jgi:hypothetical protein
MSDDKQAAQEPIEQAATRRDRNGESDRDRTGTRVHVGDSRARSFWLGLLVGAAAVALVLLVAWPLADKYVWVRDDRRLGDDFRTVVHPREGQCQLIAKALYGHGILVLTNNTYDDEGWAPKAEKAFYEGCIGGNYFLQD